MQRFFHPITAEQADEREKAAMLQSAAVTASASAAKALLKRRPGRPHKERDAQCYAVLTAAAAAEKAGMTRLLCLSV